ncbi:MAG: MerR family DNA-binding transcriptional regulator, partial [Patescibacteria group bacterium]
QATRLLKVSPDTLRRWEEEGKIKPTRTPGGHRRYTASQLTKLTAIKETKREIKIPVTIPPQVEPLISSLLPSIGEIPPLYQELHPTQTRMLGIVAVVAGIVGMVFVAEKGLSISNYIPVEQIKTNLGISPAQKLISEDTAIPQVLQAATEGRQVSFNVNVDSTNRENATFDKDVDVTGILTVGGLILSGSLTIPGDLGVNGGDFTTTSTTFNLVNTNATTLNIGGVATTISLGASSGTTTVNNALTVSGAGTFSSTFKASGASTLSSTLDVSGATTLSSTLKVSGKITASGDLQVDGALDVNGSGTHDIAGTLNLSGNTLTASGDLTLNPSGGDVILADGDVINIGGSGSDVAYSVIGDTTTGASSSVDSDDDLYIEGNLEVDGTIVGSVSSVNPGLTTGTVFFQGASGLTGDASNFFFDDTNNRLGLGTSSPARTLDVAGSTTLGSVTTDLIT